MIKNKLQPGETQMTNAGAPRPISTQLTALSLMAASLGWMSMNGLFPIPMNTLSCILISDKDNIKSSAQ